MESKDQCVVAVVVWKHVSARIYFSLHGKIHESMDNIQLILFSYITGNVSVFNVNYVYNKGNC